MSFLLPPGRTIASLVVLCLVACDAPPLEPVETVDEDGPPASVPGVGDAIPTPADPVDVVHEPVPAPAITCDFDPSVAAAPAPASGWEPATAPEPFEVDVFGIDIATMFGPATAERPHVLQGPEWQPWTAGGALATDGVELFVVDRDNGAVVVLDRHTGVATRTIAVGPRPEQIVVGPDGTAWVTIRHCGAVAQIAAGANVVTGWAEVGLEPIGLGLTPDAGFLFVTLTAEHAVVVLDAATLDEIGRLDTGLDHPRAVAVSPLGYAVVTDRATSTTRMGYAVVDGELTLTNVTTDALRANNPFEALVGEFFGFGDEEPAPDRPTHAVAATVHPVSGKVFVAHELTNGGDEESSFAAATFELKEGDVSVNSDPMTDSGGGYGSGTDLPPGFPNPARPVDATVTRVGAGPMTLAAALPPTDPVTFEPVTHLLAHPSDITHHPVLSLAFVTGFASDAVLVLNSDANDPMAAPIALIRVGHAPSAITFDADGLVAYVLNAHSFTVSQVDLSVLFSAVTNDSIAGIGSDLLEQPIRLYPSQEVAYGVDPLPANLHLGRRTFTYARNPRMSHKGEFACISCHHEGTEDQGIWFVSDGPRQTPSLAGRLVDTAPFNWLGSETNLIGNMQETVERMRGEGLTTEEEQSLAAFLEQGLVPPPNPHRSPDGTLTEAQARGEAIFHDPEVGCAGCHMAPSFSNEGLYDVGTASEVELLIAELRADALDEPLQVPVYNTPSLRGLHHTAPYLHDGSAPTLLDVLDRTAETMGKTSHLTGDEKDDLVAYLLTL